MKLSAIAISGVSVLALAGCVSASEETGDYEGPSEVLEEQYGTTPEPSPTPTKKEKTFLQIAKQYCNVVYPKGKKYVKIADEGATLLVDTKSEHGDVDNAACVTQNIDTPKRITSAIANTTAMMGAQTDSANGYSYRWSYHPDNGLNLIISSEGN